MKKINIRLTPSTHQASVLQPPVLQPPVLQPPVLQPPVQKPQVSQNKCGDEPLSQTYNEVYDGCIGIDLGTTYSCVGYWNTDHVEIIPNEDGSNTTPSWVAFTDVDKLVGATAKAQVLSNPENTLYDIKRLIGKRYSDEKVQEDLARYPFEVNADMNDVPVIKVNYKGEIRTFKPEQISAMVLSKMREIAEAKIGKTVKKAVVTVPAYFNDSQRTATRNAATIAGLDCLKIINEPTAACMCYGLDKKEDNTKVLIFDLGGGTFDVSILNLCGGVFEVLSTSGDTHLGGEDFDHLFADSLLQEFTKKNATYLGTDNPDNISWSTRTLRKFKNVAENAKRILSTSLQTSIEIENVVQDKNGRTLDFCTKVTRTRFETICDAIFRRCLEPVEHALADALLKPEDISEVILVGGSTRIPKVQELLSNYFGGITLNKSINPDEAVAYGAAVQGAISSKTDASGKTKDLLLLDVTPLSLGIEARGGIMSNIIDRNTQIPTTKSKMYSTVEDRQRSVMIQIFEGERKFTTDNHKIGDFELTGIPAQARGVPKINVTFSIIADGILSVKAVDRDSGVANDITITDTTRLSQEEINHMVDEAVEFRAEDELRKEALNSRHDFEKELSHIQQSINDPQLISDDEGKPILDEKERALVNEFLLNNFVWLEENDDLTKDKIENAKTNLVVYTKPYMNRLYARKKQLDLCTRYQEKDETLDANQVQNIIDNIFTTAPSRKKPLVIRREIPQDSNN